MRAFEAIALDAEQRDARELRRELLAEGGEHVADGGGRRQRFERAMQSIEDTRRLTPRVVIPVFDCLVRTRDRGLRAPGSWRGAVPVRARAPGRGQRSF